MKKKIPAYPFYLLLYPIFFVFHGFVENFYLVSISSALLLTAIYWFSFTLLCLFFHFFYKKIIPAALLASFIMSFHFFFGYLYDPILKYFENTFLVKYTFLISFFIALAIGLFFILRRIKNLKSITIYLNILFVVLIMIDIISLIGKIINANDQQSDNQLAAAYIRCDSCTKPDVYIIMLDGYAGADQLIHDLGYDNTPFFDSLGLRGFKTIQNSHSNYNYTPYSTASILNMEYLDSTKAPKESKKGNKYVAGRINKNKIISFFNWDGYKFFNYSIFKADGQASPTGGSFVPANTKLITGNTFVTRFEKDVLLNTASKLKLKWYLSKLLNAANNDNKKLYDLTMKIAEKKTSTPKIVYTHLLMPHHPYYYNEEGIFKNFESVSSIKMDDTAAYLSYLKYTNSEMIRLIDHILSKSASPPIIILLSDHGFRYTLTDERKYVFSNLISLHLPSKNYTAYSDTLSNVNLFRALLNNEFKQHLPLLDDKFFHISF